MTELGKVADHVVPHRGDDRIFWEGELQTLCEACHSRLKQREEIYGHTDDVDLEGWPTDPRHLANAQRHR